MQIDSKINSPEKKNTKKIRWYSESVKLNGQSHVFPCNDNTDINRNNIIFTIKDTKLYVLEKNLSAKDNQELSKLCSKGF